MAESPQTGGLGEETWRAIVEGASTPILVCCADGAVAYLNPAAEERTGYRAGDLADVCDLFVPGDAKTFKEDLARKAEGKQAWQVETTARRADGSVFPVSVTCAPLAGEPRRIIVSFLDSSDIHSSLASLLQTERLSALGAVLSGLSHELNNPMAIICGYAELLRDQNCPKPIDEYVGTILTQAERCRTVIANLLALSRTHDPDLGIVYLNELVENALDLLAYELRTRSITVVKDLGDHLPPTWASAQRLLQAIIALVMNSIDALEAMSAGQIHVATALVTGPAITIEFRDTGPGIASDLKRKIFLPFFTTRSVSSNPGLGLSLAFHVIKEHGGWIAEIGQEGKGAHFRIWLPLHLPPARENGDVDARSTTDYKALSPTEPPKALIVDDEPDAAAFVKRMLEAEGLVCHVETDGAKARTNLLENDYDLILMDLRMPGVSGFELYQELAVERPYHLNKIAFCTGDYLNRNSNNLLKATNAPVLRKPFLKEELLEVVDRILGPGWREAVPKPRA